MGIDSNVLFKSRQDVFVQRRHVIHFNMVSKPEGWCTNDVVEMLNILFAYSDSENEELLDDEVNEVYVYKIHSHYLDMCALRMSDQKYNRLCIYICPYRPQRVKSHHF